jgi:hypothetical protein
MFLKNRVYLFFVLISSLFVGSCKKAPNYSIIPSINFVSINTTAYPATSSQPAVDSIGITFGFKDGDGDIGNSPAQNYDFFVNLLKKKQGTFQVIISDTSQGTSYNGSLPLLSPYNVTGPIDGNIKYNIPFQYHSYIINGTKINYAIVSNGIGQYSTQDTIFQFDTLRFQIQIKDRANHFSNKIETTPIVIWQDTSIFN